MNGSIHYLYLKKRLLLNFFSCHCTSLPKLYGPSNLKYLKLTGEQTYIFFSRAAGNKNYFIGNEFAFHQLFQLLRFFIVYT
jgi:hypothetical protein